jgi:hypothetical protein
MRQGIVGVVLATIVVAGGETASAQKGSPAVRPEDAGIRELIAGGMERSATFRDLSARLDTSDLIVYVRFSRCSGGVPACLVWASSVRNVRRLLIKVDRFGRSAKELTALLAHELQHANEVASDSGITDLASFRKSFATRGWKHGTGFETGEAITISKRVAAELTRSERDGGFEQRRP